MTSKKLKFLSFAMIPVFVFIVSSFIVNELITPSSLQPEKMTDEQVEFRIIMSYIVFVISACFVPISILLWKNAFKK